jgi:hypothetical protein
MAILQAEVQTTEITGCALNSLGKSVKGVEEELRLPIMETREFVTTISGNRGLSSDAKTLGR